MEAFGVEQEIKLDAEPPRRPAVGRLPDLRLRRGVHRHRRQHRPLRRLALEEVGRRGSRTRSRRTTSRRSRRSCASCGCATSAGSSSSTSSTWRARRTAPRSRRRCGEELERDRTKTYVVEISPLGLVEMTRQNVTDGPREVMTRKCPTCGGDGIVVSEHTAAVDDRAQAARARHARLAREGVQGRGRTRRSRALVVGPGRHAAARARGDDEAPLLPRRQGRRASRPLPRARPGHAREGRAEAAGRRSARSSS